MKKAGFSSVDFEASLYCLASAGVLCGVGFVGDCFFCWTRFSCVDSRCAWSEFHLIEMSVELLYRVPDGGLIVLRPRYSLRAFAAAILEALF